MSRQPHVYAIEYTRTRLLSRYVPMGEISNVGVAACCQWTRYLLSFRVAWLDKGARSWSSLTSVYTNRNELWQRAHTDPVLWP